MQKSLPHVRTVGVPLIRRLPRRVLLDLGTPLVALLVLLGYFAATSPSFLSTANLLTLTQVIGPLLLVALGASFVVVIGSIDLSVGSVAMLAGSVTAQVLANTTWGPLAASLLGLGVGALCGLVNGILLSYARVPSFIVTLGGLSVYQGISLKLIDGSPVQIDNQTFTNLAVGQLVPNIANMLLWAIGLWLVLSYVGFRTRFGRYLYAIGGAERVARFTGLPVNRIKIYAFVLSALTAALAGVLSTAQLSSAGPTLGSTFLLDSLAAIVVGSTALSGGVGGVHRTLLGVLIIAVLDDGLNLGGVDEFTQEVIKGAVIVIAAAVIMLSLRKQEVK